MFRRTVYVYSVVMFLLFIAVLGTGSAALGNSTYIEAVGRQSTYTLTVAIPRKTIYDRNLQPLTNAKKKYISAVVPSMNTIGLIQSVTDNSQHERIHSAFESNKPFLIEVRSPLNTTGVSTYTVYDRYSDPQPASNLIGYLENEKAGISGIEKYFDSELREDGEIRVTFAVDAIGQAIQGVVTETEVDYTQSDAGIALTLDRSIQMITESSCSAIRKGAAVVLECRTGNILAMASFPSLNTDNIEQALDDPDEPFINRALCAYTPGSIFKLLSAAAALDNGVDYKLPYTCNGYTEVDGMKFSCFNQMEHGEVNMHTALRKSCNGYFIHLVDKLGVDKVYTYAENFYFGESLNLSREFVSAAGTLPDISNLRNPRASANFSFGQGETTITPLHAAAFINTIASEGVYYPPRIFLGSVNENKEIIFSLENETNKLLEPTTADRLRAYMESTARFGTAREGCPKNCLAGIKTGTAQTGVLDQNGSEIQNFWYAGYICDSDEIPIYTIIVMEESSGESHVPGAFKKIAETLADFT